MPLTIAIHCATGCVKPLAELKITLHHHDGVAILDPASTTMKQWFSCKLMLLRNAAVLHHASAGWRPFRSTMRQSAGMLMNRTKDVHKFIRDYQS